MPDNDKPTVPKNTRVRNLIGHVQRDPVGDRRWVADEIEEYGRLYPLLDQYSNYNYAFQFGATENPDIEGVSSSLYGMSSGYAGSFADVLPIIPSLE